MTTKSIRSLFQTESKPFFDLKSNIIGLNTQEQRYKISKIFRFGLSPSTRPTVHIASLQHRKCNKSIVLYELIAI